MRKYDLIAIDLDGTLYQPDATIHENDRRAVLRAADSGVRVVICTGRSRTEAMHAVDTLGLQGPMVTAGGAITVCAATGKTLDRSLISPDRAARLIDEIHMHGEPALVLKDKSAVGFDYLVVDGSRPGKNGLKLDPVFDWWFREQGLRVKHVGTLLDDPHPEHTVRIGAGGLSSRINRLHDTLSDRYSDECDCHHFPAVSHAGRDRELPEGESLHVLEAFAKDANKWSAVSKIAAGIGIPGARIAAIGDQVNDLPMIRAAGLGIAMGNAIPSVRSAAGRVTATNVEQGVSHAIERILSGEW